MAHLTVVDDTPVPDEANVAVEWVGELRLAQPEPHTEDSPPEALVTVWAVEGRVVVTTSTRCPSMTGEQARQLADFLVAASRGVGR